MTPVRNPRIARSMLLPRAAVRAAAALLLTVSTLAACAAPSAAAPDEGAEVQALGIRVVTDFYTVLQLPDAERSEALRMLLAPEFHRVCPGRVEERSVVLTSSGQVGPTTFSDLHAVRSGDSLFVTYTAETKNVVDGVEKFSSGPRVTTFRDIDGKWGVVLHVLFACPG